MNASWPDCRLDNGWLMIAPMYNVQRSWCDMLGISVTESAVGLLRSQFRHGGSDFREAGPAAEICWRIRSIRRIIRQRTKSAGRGMTSMGH